MSRHEHNASIGVIRVSRVLRVFRVIRVIKVIAVIRVIRAIRVIPAPRVNTHTMQALGLLRSLGLFGLSG